MRIKDAPIARPPWMRPMGNKRGYGLQQDRPAAHAKIYGLTIIFSKNNPLYSKALEAERLFVRIVMPDGNLAVVDTTEKAEKVLDAVEVVKEGVFLRDSYPLVVDGWTVSLFDGEHSLPAEKIYTRLGKVPSKHKRKIHVPPPDPWAWPENLPLRPDVSVDDKRIAASYVLQLAEESRFQADQLVVSRRDNKLVITSDGECLGIMPDTDAGTGRQRIYPAKEAPALNYGPYYESLIDRKLLESDERSLAGLFLYDAEGFRRSFKLLDLYARDYFSRRPLALYKTVKLVNLWLEGVSLIEKVSWYLPEEKGLLLGAPRPISTARLPESEIIEALAGTVRLSQRLGDFSDRQFAVVKLFYEEIARRHMETLSPASLATIRREYYGSR